MGTYIWQLTNYTSCPDIIYLFSTLFFSSYLSPASHDHKWATQQVILQMYWILQLHVKRLWRTALEGKWNLAKSPKNLRQLGLLLKRLGTTLSKSLNRLGRESTVEGTWRRAGRQCLRASVMMLEKCFIRSEMKFLTKPIKRTIWIDNVWAKLQPGQYLHRNSSHFVHKGSPTTLWNSSPWFSISPPLQPHPVCFWEWSFLKLHTWLSLQSLLGICTLMKPGNSDKSSLWKKLLMQLWMLCSNNDLTSQSLAQFGERLYRIGLSILRSFMHQ